MGLIAWVMYIVFFLIALTVATMGAIRKGAGEFGLGWAAVTMVGAVLMWAFVSLAIGLAENDSYAGSPSFVLTLAIGIIGVLLFLLGAVKLRPSAGE